MRHFPIGPVVLVVMACFIGGTLCRGDPLARNVEEVYLDRGEVPEQLMELVAQIQVRARLMLGRVPELKPPEPKPGQSFYPPPPIPDKMAVRQFEHEGGSVRDILDAFCAENPLIRWREKQGGVVLEVPEWQSKRLASVTDRVLPRYVVENASLTDAGQRILRIMESEGLPSMQRVGRDGDLYWMLYPEGPSNNPYFATRVAPQGPLSLDLRNALFRDVLDALVTQAGPSFFWGAADVKPTTVSSNRPARMVTVFVSSWWPARRQLDMQTLLHCLCPDYDKLHGCRNVRVRAEAARRELSRRWHFHQDAVRKAILQKDILGRLARYNQVLNRPIESARWLFSLNDDALSRQMVAAMEKAGNKELMVGALPHPHVPNFVQIYLPVWQRLARDANPHIQERARRVLAWHREYLGRADSAPYSEDARQK